MRNERKLTAKYDQQAKVSTLEVTDKDWEWIASLPADVVLEIFRSVGPLTLNIEPEALAPYQPERLLKVEEVMQRTGWSRSMVMKETRLGRFPQRVVRGRWRESDVHAYVSGKWVAQAP